MLAAGNWIIPRRRHRSAPDYANRAQNFFARLAEGEIHGGGFAPAPPQISEDQSARVQIRQRPKD